jgi:virginiamycin B lyase
VAVDSGHIYWTNSEVTGTIGRADLDGQNVNQNFITGAVTPDGVAVDPN